MPAELKTEVEWEAKPKAEEERERSRKLGTIRFARF
jgi:hypothetical protein